MNKLNRSIKSIITLLLPVIFLAAVSIKAQTAVKPAGDGTFSPYQIATLENLYWVTQNPNEWWKKFEQTADIDASSSSGWDGGNGFKPIGNSSIRFTGTYEGGGHTISGLFINRSTTFYIGMFGVAEQSAKIQNLGLININITGRYAVGGLVGYNNNATITACYSSGSVSNSMDIVGGLVGHNTSSGTILNSYSNVSVSSSNANSYKGGLVGRNDGSISNSYSIGVVSGTNRIGGFAGNNAGTINNSFWGTQTSGQSNAVGAGSSTGITGKTTTEMKTLPTFTNESWDFTGEIINGTDDIWSIDGSFNSGYPYLTWQLPPNTSPTASNNTVNPNEGQTFTFSTSDFQYSDADSDPLAHIQITNEPVAGNLFVDLNDNGTNDGGSELLSSGSTVTKSNLDANRLKYIPDDLTSSSFIFKVNDGTDYSISSYTMILTVNAQPTVTINQASGQNDTTNSSPINFTVVFSETVTGFGSGDITLGGTAPGSLVATVTGSGTTYNAAVAGMTGSGTVTASIAAGAASDAGNAVNKASTSTDNTITYNFLQPSGSGTVGDPYLIATLDDLKWVSENPSSWDKYFLQTADIDASSTSTWNSGDGFTPIGNGATGFTGTYDGGGYTITGLYINNTLPDFVGMFGLIGFSGNVKNTRLVNVNIKGRSYTGGLAGHNRGTITDCYSTGSVSGRIVGGLAGGNTNGTINGSYSNCSVNSSDHAGGLVGVNDNGTISNSYSTGSVSGVLAGGLVGENGTGPASGTITNCFSTGSVSGSGSYVGGLVGYGEHGDITNSFWDIETSSQATSVGGTGKTTAEMKKISTFFNAGWDLETETTNGTDDFWDIDITNGIINNGYPFLSWQNGTSTSVSVTTPTVSIGTPSSTLTNTDPVTFSITYSNAEIVNLTTGNITLNKTGTADGIVSVTNGTTTNPTVTVNGITGDGTLGIGITAGTSFNGFAEQDNGAGLSTTFTIDNAAPSGYLVSIDQAAINSTNSSSISFTFSGAEVGTTYNYTLSSSGGGTNVTGSGTITSAGQQITGINLSGLNDGTIALTVTLTDAAGNTGTVGIDTKTKDTNQPSVTITSTETNVKNNVPFLVTIDFSEDVSGFVQSDVVVNNGAINTFTVVSANQYTIVIIPSSTGTITVDVAGSAAQDGAGNDNISAVQFSVGVTNNVPVLADIESTNLDYTESETAKQITTSITVTDVDDTNIENAIIQITENYQNGEDVLSFVDQNGITGSWYTATGTMILSGSSSKINYETALRSIKYYNSNNNPALSQRTVSFTINDGNENSNTVTRNINIIPVNNAPILAEIENSELNYIEDESEKSISSTITISDIDDVNIESAIVQILGNYTNGQDVLSFIDQNGITGSWDTATGTMTLSGSSSKTNYETALRDVKYYNTSFNPTTSQRTISFVVNDGVTISNTLTRQINVIAKNNAPELANIEVPGLSYTENDPATQITNSITITDVDDTNMDSAVVKISDNYQNGEDVLSFVSMNGISATWDVSTGTLKLSGTATKADYETSLRNVKYSNKSNNPNTSPRTISFTVNDGDENSIVVSRLIYITNINDAPIVSFQLSPPSVNEDESLTITYNALSPFISDKDNSVDELMISFEYSGDNLTITEKNDSLLYIQPKKNWNGLDSIIIKVSDGHTITSAPFAINIISVNDLPKFVGMVTDTLKLNGSKAHHLDIFEIVSDVETPTELLKFEFHVSNDSVHFSFDSENGILNLSAAEGYRGNTTLTIVATDEDGGIGETSMVIKVIRNITGVEELAGQIPKDFELYQNYPNPFNPSTIIRYGLPEESKVIVMIYNILGQEVQTLFNGIQNAGYHEQSFNGSRLASGIYIYTIVGESTVQNKKYSQVKKMLLVK